jgi:hypothetical protein
VKIAVPLLSLLALSLAACNTLEDRRSLYSPAKGSGPYTRQLQEGTWKDRKTVDEQYAEAQKQKKRGTKAATPAPETPPATPPGT